MSNSKKKLIEKALITALRERKKISNHPYKPFCLYDFIEKQEVEIKFVSISSLEGIYSKEPGPLILLSSLRPHGRQYYNCAHEYGHHVFKHGMELDEITNNHNTSSYNPNEFLVDAFAGFLLMPKSTVKRAFSIRDVGLNNVRPLDVYRIASNIGVGYKTLAFHLYRSLRMINRSVYRELSKVKVSNIKEKVLGQRFPGELIYVDKQWEGRPIDLQVNDLIAIDDDYEIEGSNLKKIDRLDNSLILKGHKTGISKIKLNSSKEAHFVRVSRDKYNGFNKYKHLEE